MHLLKTTAFLFFFFLCSANNILAQANIGGFVTDQEGKALYGVSITVYQTGGNSIIGYAISLNNGQYNLVFNTASDSVDIAVSHIGYAATKKRVLNQSQQLSFSLFISKIELPVILVDNKLPINKRGDTLNYDVKTFTAKTDRVIADVLKKLPGIEVEANGQVKYNGKPISNYYIEGLDLLEGRYSIANKNIPANMVEKVQVLENHQPVKALDSIVFSDRAALNIKLTPAAKDKFFTTAKIGGGIAPLLWQDEILTFNFRKKFQFISGYKTNNTGTNVSNEIAGLTTDQFDNLFFLSQKQDLLSLINPSPPPFEEKRYLFNQTHLFYSNGLLVTGKLAQLKYHISYLNNKKQHAANSKTVYYLPQDTINITENQQQNSASKKLVSDFGLTVNKTKFYIKNNLKFEGYWNKAKGVLENVTGTIQQQLNNPLYQVINNFHIIFSKNRNTLEINSNSILKNLPQQLTILPGPFAASFNQGINYEGLKQEATQKITATDNYLLFRKHLFAFNQSIKMGLSYQSSSIISAAFKNSNSSWRLLADSMKNNLHWREIKPYTEIGMYVLRRNYQINITSTLVSNTVARTDFVNDTSNTKTYLFVNNSIEFKKNIGPYYNFTLALGNDNNINSINQNTLGYIINTYRNVSKNNFALQKSKNYTSNFLITYRNPFKTLVAYFSSSYSIANSNLLTDVLYNNELQSTNSVESNNQQKTLSFLFNLHKFFKKSKTTIGMDVFLNNTNYPQLQQNNLSEIWNKTAALKLNVSTGKSERIYPELNATFTRTASKINAAESSINLSPVSQITANFNLNVFITNELIFTAASSYYYTGQNSSASKTNVFVDSYIAYKKGKYNIELKLLNLSNIKNFRGITLSENMQAFTNYQLRPTNALIVFYLKF